MSQALLRYPGAKWRLSSWIVSHFPAHHVYLEPFCGSAACFFAKEPSRSEIINDKDHAIFNLFQIIRSRPEELAASLEMTPWSYEEYQQSYQKTGDDLEDARRFTVRCWQAHSTRTGSRSGWRQQGKLQLGKTVTLWNQLPEQIITVAQRLKQAEIANEDATKLIRRYNAPHVLIYADPPYVLDTRHSGIYKHEMSDEEHRALLDALLEHRGPVVLSGYEHPIYKKLTGWRKETKKGVNENGNTRDEVLWIKQNEKQMKLW